MQPLGFPKPRFLSQLLQQVIATSPLEWPANYKSIFTNYFSGDRQNGKQFILLYANDIAVQGAGTDGKLPYGSILIGELTPAIKNADGEPYGKFIRSSHRVKLAQLS